MQKKSPAQPSPLIQVPRSCQHLNRTDDTSDERRGAAPRCRPNPLPTERHLGAQEWRCLRPGKPLHRVPRRCDNAGLGHSRHGHTGSSTSSWPRLRVPPLFGISPCRRRRPHLLAVPGNTTSRSPKSRSLHRPRNSPLRTNGSPRNGRPGSFSRRNGMSRTPGRAGHTRPSV